MDPNPLPTSAVLAQLAEDLGAEITPATLRSLAKKHALAAAYSALGLPAPIRFRHGDHAFTVPLPDQARRLSLDLAAYYDQMAKAAEKGCEPAVMRDDTKLEFEAHIDVLHRRLFGELANPREPNPEVSFSEEDVLTPDLDLDLALRVLDHLESATRIADVIARSVRWRERALDIIRRGEATLRDDNRGMLFSWDDGLSYDLDLCLPTNWIFFLHAIATYQEMENPDENFWTASQINERQVAELLDLDPGAPFKAIQARLRVIGMENLEAKLRAELVVLRQRLADAKRLADPST